MNNAPQVLTDHDRYLRKTKTARIDLLLILILSVINIVLLFSRLDYFFLFSATIPYYLIIFGVLGGYFPIAFAIAIVILASYLLCWIKSKHNSGWLIVAAVLFGVDTLALGMLYLLSEDMSGFLDFFLHAWLIYDLISAIVADRKLKKLTPTFADSQIVAEQAAPVVTEDEESEPVFQRSVPLRIFDDSVKFRVLLQAEYEGHQVLYCRVKKVNQLVIDRYVYDEVTFGIEPAHELTANFDGHTYSVGYDGRAHSYFRVDDVTVSKKVRWY